MKVTARVQNERGRHAITLVTNGKPHAIIIPPNDSGFGSKANGGELLFLALATCYCNDIYREAARRDIQVTLVEVEVTGDFGGPGEPARNVTYRAKVTAQGSHEEIHDLMIHTDQVAEVHNSLRQGTSVTLRHVEPEPVTQV
jgi:organic hydroperoxide reductase OsmC/OhrA